MSCNKQQTIKLATVTVTSHDNGRIVGNLTRLIGSDNTLTAIPDSGYKHTGWYDSDGLLISDSQSLRITKWKDMSVVAQFDPIIISYQDFADKDALESLVYYLESHGSGTDVGVLVDTPKYYSAGDWSTSPHGSTRLMTTGVAQCVFPVTRGYNYGPHPTLLNTSDPPQPIQSINHASYNEIDNTTTGVYHRSPAIYESKSEISIPDILKVPRNSSSFPTSSTYRGWRHINCTESTTSWNQPNYKTYTSPNDGSAPVMFPLLKYHCSVIIVNNYVDEVMSFDGLEQGEFHAYIHSNGSYGGRHIKSLDPISQFKNFRSSTTGNSGWRMISDTTNGSTGPHPRVLEPMGYCDNLTRLHVSGHTTNQKGIVDSTDINMNPSWSTNYQTRPLCGSTLNTFRYTPIQSLGLMQGSSVGDLSLSTMYFKQLRGLHFYQANIPNAPVLDVSDISLNLNFFVIYDNYIKLNSMKFLEHSNLNYFAAYHQNNTQYVSSFAPFKGKKLKYINLQTTRSLIQDPWYHENVKLHMNFDSPQMLTQDSTRHANKLNNYGATISST